MTNSQSKPATNKAADHVLHHIKSFPPAITFSQSKKAKEKREPSDYREIEILLDPNNQNSQKMKKSSLYYEEGDPETWCEGRKQLDEVIRALGIKNDATKQEKVATSLLCG